MFNYVTNQDMLHKFGCYTFQGNRSIIWSDVFLLFLKIGETFAFNQSVEASPVTYDFQKVKVSDGAISTANS